MNKENTFDIRAERFDELAELFKLFSDGTRLRIMNTLMEGEKSVSGISESLGMSQSAISHQLNGFKHSRLIKSRKEGKSVYYSLDDDHVREILQCGLEHICEK